jgi:hypothetical protein
MVDFIAYKVKENNGEYLEIKEGYSSSVMQGRGIHTLAEKWVGKSKEIKHWEMGVGDCLTTIPVPYIVRILGGGKRVVSPLEEGVLEELEEEYFKKIKDKFK